MPNKSSSKPCGRSRTSWRLWSANPGWLERKWAYACGFTGEAPGDALPKIVHQSPVVLNVPGADDANDVVYLSAKDGKLYCLERTMSADGSHLSDSEGAYVMRAGDRGAFIEVTPLDLESFLRCLGPAAVAANREGVVRETSASQPGGFSIGNAIMFAMFGGILGGLVGFGLVIGDIGGEVALWASVVLGVLVGIALSARFTKWQRGG